MALLPNSCLLNPMLMMASSCTLTATYSGIMEKDYPKPEKWNKETQWCYHTFKCSSQNKLPVWLRNGISDGICGLPSSPLSRTVEAANSSQPPSCTSCFHKHHKEWCFLSEKFRYCWSRNWKKLKEGIKHGSINTSSKISHWYGFSKGHSER